MCQFIGSFFHQVLESQYSASMITFCSPDMRLVPNGAQPAHRPVGLGLHIFGLITLFLEILVNYGLLG